MNHLLVRGDARRIPLPDTSVHCVITSPPYFGLRDYSTPGQIGLEPTPDEFVAAMVRVFREVRRVLRDDGTCWMNLGDAYTHASCGGGGAVDKRTDGRKTTEGDKVRGRMGGVNTLSPGLKPKDLIGIPWRVAFALQADGWYLRSDIIWSKSNPMPESVTDWPTKSHEYLFLLAKSERYFFDAEAVREKAGTMPHHRGGVHTSEQTAGPMDRNGSSQYDAKEQDRVWAASGNRNIRSVWSIPTEPYPGSHFATYPRRLVEPCIKAGTSERGCCPACGAPWERVVERESVGTNNGSNRHDMATNANGNRNRLYMNLGGGSARSASTTTGWRPSCICDAGEPVPCTVLDPFCGSGTTGMVATALGRRFVGLDLSAEYLRLAARRIERPHARVERSPRVEFHPLFDGIDHERESPPAACGTDEFPGTETALGA